ncbi:Glucuronosyltransferase [Aphelenchoides bicaudatus]|nr:Glucuronosyltransferase [Aphelenchoides bicaudatus]
MNKIADVLMDGGHEVVIYMPDMGKNFGASLNNKRARIIERPLGFEPEVIMSRLGLTNEWQMGDGLFEMWSTIKSLFQHFVRSCDHQLCDEALMEQLRKEKFDLGITEFFDLCGMGIFDKIGLKKHIIVHSNTLDVFNGLAGIPSMPSYNPCKFYFRNCTI